MKQTYPRFFLSILQFLLFISLYSLTFCLFAETPEKPAIHIPAPEALNDISLSASSEAIAQEVSGQIEEVPAIDLSKESNKDTQKLIPAPEEYLSHVPNLIGLTKDEAIALLPESLLILGTITEVTNKASAGTVIAQSVNPNTDIKPNSPINLTISMGLNEKNKKSSEQKQEIVEKNSDTQTNTASSEEKQNNETSPTEYLSLVPNLIGLTIKEAEKKLPDYELVLGNISELANKKAPQGQIIAQSEQADSHIKRSSAINIIVSSGSEESAKKATTNEKENKLTIPEPDIIEPSIARNEDTSNTESEQNTQHNTDNKNKKITIVEKEAATKQQSEEESTPQAVAKKPAPSLDVTISKEKIDIDTPTNTSSHSKVQIDAPKGLQTKRKIHFTVIPPVALSGKQLEYSLSLSGNVYKQSSPTFTTTFTETGNIILTGSVRIPRQSWHHSSSKQISIKEYEAIKIKVPNIVGMDEKKAKKTLEKAGLQLGNIQKTVKGEKVGIVEQRPKAGATLTEDNNTVHLVKAIGKKYKVLLSSNNKTIDAEQSLTLTAEVTPKPKPSDINYRFIVNNKTHYSKTATWKYTPKEAGTKRIKVEVHVKNEGAFHSDTLKVAVKSAWISPKAVITPAKLTVKQGELAKFNSRASTGSDKKLTSVWRDPNKKQHKGSDFSLDTKKLKAGSYPITLTVSDQREMNDTVKAILLVEEEKPQLIAKKEKEAATPESNEETKDDKKDKDNNEGKESNNETKNKDVANTENDPKNTQNNNGDQTTESLSEKQLTQTDQTDQVDEKEKEKEKTTASNESDAPEKDATNKSTSENNPQNTAATDTMPSNVEDALKQTLAAEATQTMLKDTPTTEQTSQIPVSADAEETSPSHTAKAENTPTDNPTIDKTKLEPVSATEPPITIGENEALVSATKPTEPTILEVDVPDNDVDIKPSTQKATVIEANTNTMPEKRDWTLWLWLGILGVLFIAIFWFLHKLR